MMQNSPQSAVRSQQPEIHSGVHPLRATDYRLRTRAFTLIELVVVTAIMTIITGLVLANNAKFGSVITLENLGYDVGLAIRKAQVYGISVRGSGGVFAPGYGAHFEAASPDSFWLFPDYNNNGLYDAGSEVQLESETFRAGYRMVGLYATNDSNSLGASRTKLDVLFKRPEPGAYIYADGTTATQYSQAQIVIQSPQGDIKTVVVDVAGQITVK